ncbi:MAG: pyridoxal-phosphate dependent enzyme [Gammaproteobacteria bacterium]
MLPRVKKPALFERFPELQLTIPWVSLTCGPTPVQPLENLGNALGTENVWIKRDDLCGQPYGGNKPRKLEFLLAEALQKKAKTVLTLGALGSHHTLATAVYCNQLGLHPLLGLANRPLGERERPNLLSSQALGATLFFMPKDYYLLWKLPVKWLKQVYTDKKIPYFIPPGGSSLLGCLGYVSAAFELAAQIESGSSIAPDEIYLPAGSLGTIAGLLLGIELAGLTANVVGVKIYPSSKISSSGVFHLVKRCHAYLKKHIGSLPVLRLIESDIVIVDEYLGAGYAHTTQECEQAITLMQSTEDIRLEHVYTGKCLAALIQAVRQNRQDGKQFLFWNTYNSLPYQDSLPSAVVKTAIEASLLPYLSPVVDCTDSQ